MSASGAAAVDSLLRESTNQLNAGHAAHAKQLAEQARKTAQENGNAYWVTLAAFKLANAFQASTNFEAATPLYQEVIQQADIRQDSLLLAKALTHFGLMQVRMEKYQDGQSSIEHAIRLLQLCRDTYELAFCHSHLATSHYLNGQYKKAIQHFEMAEELAKTQGLTVVMASSYQNLGQAHAELGNDSQAVTYTLQAVELGIKLGDVYYVNECFKNLLYLQDSRENYDRVLATNQALFDTLQAHAWALDPSLCEPQSYLMGEVRAAHSRLQQRASLYQWLLAAIAALAGAALVWQRARHRRRWQAINDRSSHLRTIPRDPSSLAYHGLPTLEERTRPLLEHSNAFLLPCYTLLAANVSISQIARSIGRSRKRTQQYVHMIAQVLNIPPDQVREDALKHSRSS